jgi:ABC-type Fe3+ transport system permease subunit
LWQDYVGCSQFRSQLIEEEHAAKRASLRKEEIRKKQKWQKWRDPKMNIMGQTFIFVVVLLCSFVPVLCVLTQGAIARYFRWKGISFEDTNRGKTAWVSDNKIMLTQKYFIWLVSFSYKQMYSARTISISYHQCAAQTRNKLSSYKMFSEALRL